MYVSGQSHKMHYFKKVHTGIHPASLTKVKLDLYE